MPPSVLPPPQSPLRIASRGSKLALKQAETVQALLKTRGVIAEIKVITTTGDRIQDRFLYEIGGKGLFIKEIEQSLQTGGADLAVHSLKDLPAVVSPGFALPAVLPRGPATDALLLPLASAQRLGWQSGQLLAREALSQLGRLRVGTGSLRRRALLTAASPALEVRAMRGNVDTRLAKLLVSKGGEYDGLILATAALERIELSTELRQQLCIATLDPQWFVPSSSQGALVLETLASSPLRGWLSQEFNHRESSQCVAIERGVLAALGGDCTLPIGVHAVLLDQAEVRIQGFMADLTGHEVRWTAQRALGTGGEEDCRLIAENFAQSLLACGGDEILRVLRSPGTEGGGEGLS